jgi:hypothetical protein
MDSKDDVINTVSKAKREALQAGATIYPVAKDVAVKIWKVISFNS